MYNFCPQCGMKNNGYKFCPSCGMRLSDAPAPERNGQVKKDVKQVKPVANDHRFDEKLYSKPDEFVICDDMLVSYLGDAAFIEIPDGVTVIGARAFFGKNILSVTIPASVKSIRSDAFACCYPLTEVYNLSTLDIKIGEKDYGQVARLVKNVYTPNSGESKLDVKGDFVFFADGDAVLLLDYIGGGATLDLPDGYDGKPYTISRDGWFHRTFYRCRDRITKIVFPSAERDVNSKVNDGAGSAHACGFTTVIGEKAFSNFNMLAEIDIPDGVTEICDEAFADCRRLFRVSLPDSLIDVDGTIEVLDDVCGGLADVYIRSRGGKSDLRYEGDYIYRDGEVPTLLSYTGRARNLTLPSTLGGKSYNIGERAFEYSNSLVRVTVPDGVAEIGVDAFDSCVSLRSIIISASVKQIANGAFESFRGIEIIDESGKIAVTAASRIKDKLCAKGCGKLVAAGDFLFSDDGRTVRLHGYLGDETDVKTPDDFRGKHYVVNTGALSFNDKMKSVTFGSGVDGLNQNCCAYCPELEKASIPRSVRYLESPFDGCSKLDEIYYAGSVADWMNMFAGDDCRLYSNNTKYYPDHCYELYCNGAKATDVTVPANVNCKGAFAHCMSIEHAAFQAGTKTIPAVIFGNAQGLRSVDIPESVTEIGEYAFELSGLRSVTLPSSLRDIGENAFYECRLAKATVNTREPIMYMFPDCIELTDIKFNAVPSEFDEGALSGTGLTSFAVPNGVRSIGVNAFAYCDKLASITIPDSVTSIESEAFVECKALRSVSVPRNCSVDDDAFPEWCAVTRR